jgi:hypothetical protein
VDVTSQYIHEHGSYYLMHHGNVRFMCDQVAIAFAEKDRTVLKHGDPKSIWDWWQENRQKYSLLFGTVSVATLPRGFPVEEINRILDFGRIDASQTVKAELQELEGLWP